MALFFGNTVKRDNPYAYHPISKKENINTMMEHIAYFVSEEESQTQLSTFANVLYHSDCGKQGQNILHFSLYKDGCVAYFQRGLWKKGQLCSGMFRFDPDYHQYLTVNGFVSRKRTTENCFQINAAVMDFDFASSKKEKAEHATPSRIREKTVRTLEVLYDNVEKGNLPEPTMIVFTGRGIHVYYVYDRSISYRVKGGFVNKLVHMHTDLCDTLYSKVKGMLTEDCLVLDPACKDISRILRVPGSYNQKAQRHAVILTADGPYHNIFEMKKIIGKKMRKSQKRKKTDGSDNVLLFPYDPAAFMVDNDSELAERLLNDPDYLAEAKTYRIEFEPTANERYATAMQYRLDFLEKLQELCNQNGVCSGIRHSMNFLYYVTLLALRGRDFPLAPQCLASYNDRFLVPQSDTEVNSIVNSLKQKEHTTYYYSTERFLETLTNPVQGQCADLDPRYIFYHLRDDQNSQPSAYQIQHKADIEHAHFLFVEQGKSREEVAKIFGVTPTTISNWMRKAKDEYNLSSRQCKPRKEAGNSVDKRKAQRQEKMKKAVELHDQMHMTQAQIATELHVCRATISRWLSEMSQNADSTEVQTDTEATSQVSAEQPVQVEAQKVIHKEPRNIQNIQSSTLSADTTKKEGEKAMVSAENAGTSTVTTKRLNRRSRKKYEKLPTHARMADVSIMIQEGQLAPDCLSACEDFAACEGLPENGCNIGEQKIKFNSDITLCSGSRAPAPVRDSSPLPGSSESLDLGTYPCKDSDAYKDSGSCRDFRKSYELWYRYVEDLRGVEKPAAWNGDVPFGFYEDPSFYDDPDPFGNHNGCEDTGLYENMSLFTDSSIIPEGADTYGNTENSSVSQSSDLPEGWDRPTVDSSEFGLEEIAKGMEFFAGNKKLPDGVKSLEELIDPDNMEPFFQPDTFGEPVTLTREEMEFMLHSLFYGEAKPLDKSVYLDWEQILQPDAFEEQSVFSQENAENLIRNFLVDDALEGELPALQKEQELVQYPWAYSAATQTGYIEPTAFEIPSSASTKMAKSYVLGWAMAFCRQLDCLSDLEKRKFLNSWVSKLENWTGGSSIESCHFKYIDWIYAFVLQARAYQFSKGKKQKRR